MALQAAPARFTVSRFAIFELIYLFADGASEFVRLHMKSCWGGYLKQRFTVISAWMARPRLTYRRNNFRGSILRCVNVKRQNIQLHDKICPVVHSYLRNSKIFGFRTPAILSGLGGPDAASSYEKKASEVRLRERSSLLRSTFRDVEGSTGL